MTKVKEAVLIDFLRTPFSRSRPQEPQKDVFSNTRADEMLAKVIRELLNRNHLSGEEIDSLLVGVSHTWGENYTWGARNVIFLADLPYRVAGYAIDRACASSLTSINAGAMSIMLGFEDVVVAGGMEHLTRTPGSLTLGSKEPGAISHPALRSDPHYLQKYDVQFAGNMGLTAEKLFKLSGMTREDMDKYSQRSHQLASKAIQDGYFKGEILPLEGQNVDGNKVLIETDQCVRADTTLETLAKLKPAFIANGQITAGNSSPLNAGASAVILMSRDKAKELGCKPLASIIAWGHAGVDPMTMGMGPVPASQRALKNARLSVKDIDFWEINEAFAIVPLYAIQQLKLDINRVNIHGGAVAIGHPEGATGARLLGTLSRILKQNGGTYGCATLCVGAGQGVATIIKNEK